MAQKLSSRWQNIVSNYMRLTLGSCVLLTIVLSTGSANAVLLGINDQDPTQPFDITYPQNGNLSFDRVLQITNLSNPLSVLSWQLELQLHPVGGAQGSLLFQSVETPDDSMFGPIPGPFSDLVAPSDHFLAFDADVLEFLGTLLSQNEHRNILQMTISASPTASGSFEVIMPEFNPATPELGSSWFESGGMEPQAFENSSPSSVPSYILLGTIHVTSTFPVGDYNHDHVVDALDYGRWRADFGTSVVPSGQGADGNQNGVVDAADYVVWRENLPPASGALLTQTSNIPEPMSLSFSIIAMISVLPACRFRSRCNLLAYAPKRA